MRQGDIVGYYSDKRGVYRFGPICRVAGGGHEVWFYPEGVLSPSGRTGWIEDTVLTFYLPKEFVNDSL